MKFCFVGLLLLFQIQWQSIFATGPSTGPVRTRCYRSGNFIASDVDFSLASANTLATHQVSTPNQCTIKCLENSECRSYNYQRTSSTGLHQCELLDAVKGDGALSSRSGYKHYEPKPNCGELGEMCPSKIYRSCSELQSKNGTRANGEYELHLGCPRCDKAVTVYCDDMDTNNPREYITLKAGEENNFSTRSYMGAIWQDRYASSTSKFSKIRILLDLSVVRDDFKFSRITWSYNGAKNISFAFAGDCYSSSCTTAKKGVFKMDLTGTGLRFVTPILWKYRGWPACHGLQPIHYEIDDGSQVVSGKCGGYPGSCWAPNLALAIIECGN